MENIIQNVFHEVSVCCACHVHINIFVFWFLFEEEIPDEVKSFFWIWFACKKNKTVVTTYFVFNWTEYPLRQQR